MRWKYPSHGRKACTFSTYNNGIQNVYVQLQFLNTKYSRSCAEAQRREDVQDSAGELYLYT